MNRKAITGLLLSLSLVITACNTSNLQGKFSASKSTKGITSTATKLLTVTPSANTYNTITLSSVDFDYAYDESDSFDVDPTWFAVAKYSINYASGATNCASGDLQLQMNDGTSSHQYYNVAEDMFDNVRLQFRTSNGDFLGYVYPTSKSSLSKFDFTNAYTYDTSSKKYVPGALSLSGNNYFYVEVKAKKDADSTWKNLKLYVYLNKICAMKGSSKDYWWYNDSASQNSYFSATADAARGITGGWALVQ